MMAIQSRLPSGLTGRSSGAHGSLYVEAEDRDGLELTGRFESDQWDMLTVWRFEVIDERIQRLDVAAV